MFLLSGDTYIIVLARVKQILADMYQTRNEGSYQSTEDPTVILRIPSKCLCIDPSTISTLPFVYREYHILTKKNVAANRDRGRR